MAEGAITPGCPLDRVLKFLAPQWTAHIVWTLGEHGSRRFGELQRLLPSAISARVLSVRLKQFEDLGLVSREDTRSYPLKVTYSLTESGRALHGMLKEIERLSRDAPLPEAFLDAGSPQA